MPSTTRTRRHRNPHTHNEQHHSSEPFFTRADRTVKTEPFFAGKSGVVQAKLSIGLPGDQYEREADAMAEKVVSQPGNNTPGVQQKKEISTIQRLATPIDDEKLGTNDARMAKDKEIQEKPLEGSGIQKMSAPEEEEPVQMMLAPEEEEMVQSKAEGAGVASSALSNRIESAKGKGKPLPEKTRFEMESAIGADFQGVRLHMDTDATEMNRELGAQAFTNKQDIYFNSGKYNPENSAGKRLLAHELTHVIQQTGSEEKIQRDHKSKPAQSKKKVAKKIVVTLSSQTAVAMEDGAVVRSMPVSSGKKGHETDQGSFAIYEKDKDHESSLYGQCVTAKGVSRSVTKGAKSCTKGEKYKGAPMKYFLRYNGAEGLHQGKLPGHPDSHGCVRLTASDAQWLFSWAEEGTKVEVREKQPEKKPDNKPNPVKK